MTQNRQRNQIFYRILALFVIGSAVIAAYFASSSAKTKISHEIEVVKQERSIDQAQEKINAYKGKIAQLDLQHKKLLQNNVNLTELRQKLNILFKKLRNLYIIKIKKMDYYKGYNNLVYVQLEVTPLKTTLPKEVYILQLKSILESSKIKALLKPKGKLMIKENHISFIYHKQAKH